jgi:hypothetical protein
MSHKLEGKSVEKAKELIQMLARAQITMEVGHWDTLRTIMRYVKEEYPDEKPINYSTLAQWLRADRTSFVMEDLKNK